jgi:hypothetical protein
LKPEWEDLSVKSFFPLVYTILIEKVYSSFVIDCNQTHLVPIPGGNQHTYDKCAVKPVSLLGMDEK